MQIEAVSSGKLTNLRVLLENKQYEQAESLVRSSQKKSQTVAELTEIYHTISFNDEDEYENFLYLFTLILSPEVDYHLYQNTVLAILNQMIALSSLKYTIVILRSLLCKVHNQPFSKFVILAKFYIFTPLLFDPTFQDLKDLYSEFKEAQKQVIAAQSLEDNDIKEKINRISAESLHKFLHTVKGSDHQEDLSKTSDLLRFISIIVKDLTQLKGNLTDQSFLQVNLNELCLVILQKFNVLPTCTALPLPFAVSFLTYYSLQDNLFHSAIYSQSSIFRIILNTLCLELSTDLSSPPSVNHYYDKYLLEFIEAFGLYLRKIDTKERSLFIMNNFKKIQELIEKVNILIGAINPQESGYKNIMKNFIPLQFLSPLTRQRVLSSLIQKHTNINFKAHLITQYRRLITFKVPRSTWIRSIDVLFSQLKSLQANASVDYIGHILSLAYYWKCVTVKFLEEVGFKQKLFFNISKVLKQFQERLTNLRKGLQTRLQISQKAENQIQRNEINVCLFRIEQLLDEIKVDQTSKDK